MGLRDLVVLIFVSGCIVMAMRKAWHGVLALAIFSYLNPHAYSWGFVRTLPIYQLLFLVVAIKTLLEEDRQPLPKDWRIKAFVVLWLYFLFTTTQAMLPHQAWPKFWFVTKIYIPFIFTLFLINTREKLYALIVTIAASIGVVAVKGGLFAMLHGFSARVYGPPATQFEDNNQFAVAVLINVPLLILWYRQTQNKWVKRGLMVAIPLHYVCAISSWSRGALLTMVAMTLFVLFKSKRKFLIAPIILIGAIAVINVLPKEWFDRMHTLETYEQDQSAQGRLTAWRDGWNFAIRHPFTGAGFEGWRWVTTRDWHSSYVEMFAEHGFIAFGIWISMILYTILDLRRLERKAKPMPELSWVVNYSQMLRASFIAYMVGTAFLGLSYWDLLYHLIFISVLLRQFAMREFDRVAKARVEALSRNVGPRAARPEGVSPGTFP